MGRTVDLTDEEKRFQVPVLRSLVALRRRICRSTSAPFASHSRSPRTVSEMPCRARRCSTRCRCAACDVGVPSSFPASTSVMNAGSCAAASPPNAASSLCRTAATATTSAAATLPNAFIRRRFTSGQCCLRICSFAIGRTPIVSLNEPKHSFGGVGMKNACLACGGGGSATSAADAAASSEMPTDRSPRCDAGRDASRPPLCPATAALACGGWCCRLLKKSVLAWLVAAACASTSVEARAHVASLCTAHTSPSADPNVPMCTPSKVNSFTRQSAPPVATHSRACSAASSTRGTATQAIAVTSSPCAWKTVTCCATSVSPTSGTAGAAADEGVSSPSPAAVAAVLVDDDDGRLCGGCGIPSRQTCTHPSESPKKAMLRSRLSTMHATVPPRPASALNSGAPRRAALSHSVTAPSPDATSSSCAVRGAMDSTGLPLPRGSPAPRTTRLHRRA
eukprot:Rhum_TRINITY_DN2166_c0_g1::Rhum_TRINITY_DN2166_c0_g1_i1::g.6147::m.6147